MSLCSSADEDSVNENENWISYKNPEKCSVDLQNCQDLASNCSDCSSLDPELNCGWCVGKSSCLNAGDCTGLNSVWLSPGQDCSSNPEIVSFYPTSGPTQGGTNITINMANFEAIAARVNSI